jgi:hypothetical protein
VVTNTNVAAASTNSWTAVGDGRCMIFFCGIARIYSGIEQIE